MASAALVEHLPIIEGTREAKEPRSQSETIPAGSESVLLVEYEQGLRTGFANSWSTGYTLLEGSNGMEAWQISEGYQGRIDLLLTDYIMPGPRGPRLGTLAMTATKSPHYLPVWQSRPANSDTGLR